MKISVSGTYSVGKTSTVMCLSHYTGMPRTLAKAIREIIPAAVPGKRLSEVTPAEFLQLMMRRHCGRAVEEARLGKAFISDGSSLQEWAYGKARLKFGMNPTDPSRPNEANRADMGFFGEVVDQYEHAFKQHVMGTYDLFIHLENEQPISNDGHRPMNEQFRHACDELLRDTVASLGMPVLQVKGSFEDRILEISSKLKLKPVMPLEQALELAKADYGAIDTRLETER